jgi:hypothetical protein
MARIRKEMKGGAQLRKRVVTKKGTKEVDPLAAEAARLRAEEARRQKEEKLRALLKERLATEEAHSRVNRVKIQEHWRAIMRRIKAGELRREIDVLAQDFERGVDRKEALIQMLDRDLTQAEEQYLMAHRSHLQNVDALIDLQQSRLRRMEADFSGEIDALQAEFETERARINESHGAVMKELNDIMATMEAEFDDHQQEARQNFHSAKDDIKNKTAEEYNMLKLVLEAQIYQLLKLFDNAHRQYLTQTDHKTKAFKVLRVSDHQNAKTIEMQQRKLQRKHEELAHWKAKMANNVREARERNAALREEKDAIAKHFQQLKARMNAFRAGEARRLADLTINARAAIAKLESRIGKAEAILRLAELNRKLESEREKVTPFYTATVEDEHIHVDDDDGGGAGGAGAGAGAGRASGVPGAGPANVDEDLQSAAVLEDGSAIPEWNYLRNFFKKFNKVTLDTQAIRRERERLTGENAQLRSMLKQFLDGISVNDEVLATQNSLFVVNGKTSVKINAMVQPNEIPVTEGNNEVRGRRVRP